MSSISIPGERYTLWLDAAGKPVEKALAEMTAAEVVQAAQWQHDEMERLVRIAEPWDQIAEDLGRGIEPDIGPDRVKEGVAALRASAAAVEKNARLMQLILAAMPQWPGSGVNFGAAVRRYWPRRDDKMGDAGWKESGGRKRRKRSTWRCWAIEHRGRDSYVVYLRGGGLTEFDEFAIAQSFCQAIDGMTDWSRPAAELAADKELWHAVHRMALHVTGAQPDMPPPQHQ